MKKFYALIPALCFLILPFAASAISIPYFGTNPPLLSCHGTECTTCHLFSTGQNIIYLIMTLTIFVIGPIMITIGGIMMLISAGSEEKFAEGRKMITGSVVGILIALCAFLIVNALISVIAQNIVGFSGSGFQINCSATAPVTPSSQFVPSLPTNL